MISNGSSFEDRLGAMHEDSYRFVLYKLRDPGPHKSRDGSNYLFGLKGSQQMPVMARIEQDQQEY